MRIIRIHNYPCTRAVAHIVSAVGGRKEAKERTNTTRNNQPLLSLSSFFFVLPLLGLLGHFVCPPLIPFFPLSYTPGAVPPARASFRISHRLIDFSPPVAQNCTQFTCMYIPDTYAIQSINYPMHIGINAIIARRWQKSLPPPPPPTRETHTTTPHNSFSFRHSHHVTLSAPLTPP